MCARQQIFANRVEPFSSAIQRFASSSFAKFPRRETGHIQYLLGEIWVLSYQEYALAAEWINPHQSQSLRESLAVRAE
jgi:hypothetical protein